VHIGAGASQQAGGAEQNATRVVGHLQLDAHREGGTGRLQQHGAPRRAVGTSDVGELGGDQAAQPLVVGEDRVELLDRGDELVALSFQLQTREPGEPPQGHVKDVRRLHLGEVEDLHEPLAGGLRVVAAADELDHLVDVEQSQHETLHQVQAVGCASSPIARAPAHDVDAVLEEHLQQGAQTQGAGLAVDEGHGVDGERLLQRGLPEQLLEQRLRVVAVLDLDHQPQPVAVVGEVLDVGDALQLLGLHERLDPLDDLLRADVVRQLGHHDALPAGRHRLDARLGSHAERAAPGLVRLADAAQPDDLAAGGQVRSGYEAHQVVQARPRRGDQVAQCLHHLDQVVRGHVGGHAHRDARRAVDQQVGQGGGRTDGSVSRES
jgi:hypothetical protein